MHENAERDWLSELLQSDPEDPAIEKALNTLRADGRAPGRDSSQNQIPERPPHPWPGSSSQGSIRISSSDGPYQDFARPTAQLFVGPSHLPDKFRATEPSACHQISRLDSRGYEGQQRGLPYLSVGVTRNREATAVRDEHPAELNPAWRQEHQVMPLDRLIVNTFHNATPRRVSSVSGKQDASLLATTKELASLQKSRQTIQKSIETLFMKQQVIEAAERTVHRLITQLDSMTSCPGGLLTFNVEDVIGLVYSINLARGADSEGYGSYISTQYAKRCLALPFASCGRGWTRKTDTSGRFCALQKAFAFAAGDTTAGEVELELTAKTLRGHKVKFKDLVKLGSNAIQELFDKSAFAAAEIVLEALKLQPGVEERRVLQEAINLIGTEGLCLSHIHYVFSPLHYRSPQSWKFRQKGPSLQKEAAHARARASLEAAGTDMASLESLWRDRSMNLEPLELRQKELQEDVAQQCAKLQAQLNGSVDFSALLETVRIYKLSLDEAAVINSVAVTASNVCVLNSWQMAQAVAASYPHIMNYETLHALGNVY